MSLNDAFFNLAPPINMTVEEGSTSVSLANSEITFITVVLAIVVAWILVALWTRVIENFTFGTLRLDGDSSWHALIVALTITVIFLVTVWMIDRYGIIPNGLEAEIEGIDSSTVQGGSTITNNDLANDSRRNQVFTPSFSSSKNKRN